jgi:hypothetical protein
MSRFIDVPERIDVLRFRKLRTLLVAGAIMLTTAFTASPAHASNTDPGGGGGSPCDAFGTVSFSGGKVQGWGNASGCNSFEFQVSVTLTRNNKTVGTGYRYCGVNRPTDCGWAKVATPWVADPSGTQQWCVIVEVDTIGGPDHEYDACFNH